MAGAPSAQKILFNTILLQPALTSQYICRFQPPREMLSPRGFLPAREIGGWIGANYNLPFNQNLIEISCSEASLPGSSLMTNEINDDYTGVTERHAYRRQYDDRMDFTFYVDSDYRIINFFESWIAYCSGEDEQSKLDDRNYSYRVNFPNDYQTDSLYITKFERNVDTKDKRKKSSLIYQFIRAYPISIASMPISYDSSQLLKCTVSFTFIRYLISNRAVPNRVSSEETPQQSIYDTKFNIPGYTGIQPQVPPTAPGVPNPSSVPYDTKLNIPFSL